MDTPRNAALAILIAFYRPPFRGLGLVSDPRVQPLVRWGLSRGITAPLAQLQQAPR